MTQSLDRVGMKVADLLALPATTDVEAAARALGIGRTTAYQLARHGTFPCKIIRAGRAYRVVTADLLRVLHINPENSRGASPNPSIEAAKESA